MTCVQCQEPRMDNWAYCPYCGQNLGKFGSGLLSGAAVQQAQDNFTLNMRKGLDQQAQGCQMFGGAGNGSGGKVMFQGVSLGVPRAPGVKIDLGKPEVYTGAFLSFPLALQEIAKITLKGTKEPGHVLHGWKVVPEGFKRYSEAMGRHLLREALTGDPDEHTFQIATTCWNDLARLEHRLQDRSKAEG